MTVMANQPTGYDLAAAVNSYRQANGYYTLNPHPQVMAAAQAHADWIVQTGQGGHIGAGGSDETMRVAWTGYGGGAEIKCDENWGGGSSIQEVMTRAWSDPVHQEVMLNGWGNRYTDIGGGVAVRSEGSFVFVLNVCKVIGQEASGSVPKSATGLPSELANQQPVAPSNFIYAVKRATPQADGSIIHKVMYGQTLITIAEVYGVSLEELRALNKMAENATIIWEGEELLIKPPSSVTQMPTASHKAAIPITTTAPTRQITPNPSATSSTNFQSRTADTTQAARWGIWVLGLAGGSMVLAVLADIWRKRGQINSKDDPPDSNPLGW